MKHVVFVTYEFHPVNPGGAGVLIAQLAVLLAKSGVRVTVVCAMPRLEVDAVNAHLRGRGLGENQINAICRNDLAVAEDIVGFGSLDEFEANSLLFALALSRLHERDPADLIEFPEYAGMACGALRARRKSNAFAGAILAVRAHGSLELIETAATLEPIPIRLSLYALEREGMATADVVLGPSGPLLDYYSLCYAFDRSAALVAEPPMQSLLADLERVPRTPQPAHFLFYGKLQEVKGCDIFASAATYLLSTETSIDWHFTLIGRDVPCAEHKRATSECLAEIIPVRLRSKFTFVPQISRVRLGEVAATATAAVVPSRFESFCLAAHELRAVGVPLVVPRIAGFEQHLTEDAGCLRYDGSATGLAGAMLALAKNSVLATQKEKEPPPHYGSWSSAYEELLGMSFNREARAVA